ncbi:MAG: hypothetical protein IV100_34845 [Myxococcales bacterium]|nr:hypothetical protein [Myxococcales bacterium]
MIRCTSRILLLPCFAFVFGCGSSPRVEEPSAVIETGYVSCRASPDCPGASAQCINDADATHCIELPAECAGTLSCACLAATACGGLSCQDEPNGVSCVVPEPDLSPPDDVATGEHDAAPEPVEGYCVSSADQTIIAAGVDREVFDCAIECGPDTPVCLRKCVATATGLTANCSICFAAETECARANCLADCVAGPFGPECAECRAAACGAELEHCAYGNSAGTDGLNGADETDGGDGVDSSVDGTNELVDGCPVSPPAGYCDVGSTCHLGQCCTCSGKDCGAGVDNALSVLSPALNAALDVSIPKGELNLLLAVRDGDVSQKVVLATGSLEPGTSCDSSFDSCLWQVDLGSWGPDCELQMQMSDAVLEGDSLTAGGSGSQLRFSIPLLTSSLDLRVLGARLNAVVIQSEGTIGHVSGLITGGMPKVELDEGLDSLDDDALPIDRLAVKQVLNTTTKPDLDLLDASGMPGTDGIDESYSLTLRFHALPGDLATLASAPMTPEAGQCLGSDATELLGPGFRVTDLSFGVSGQPGDGADLDGVCVPANLPGPSSPSDP